MPPWFSLQNTASSTQRPIKTKRLFGKTRLWSLNITDHSTNFSLSVPNTTNTRTFYKHKIPFKTDIRSCIWSVMIVMLCLYFLPHGHKSIDLNVPTVTTAQVRVVRPGPGRVPGRVTFRPTGGKTRRWNGCRLPKWRQAVQNPRACWILGSKCMFCSVGFLLSFLVL